MQSLELRNETLVEIATFLVRRWSENDDIIAARFETKRAVE